MQKANYKNNNNNNKEKNHRIYISAFQTLTQTDRANNITYFCDVDNILVQNKQATHCL